MNDFKIIFVHGYTASHVADWYPDIAQSLAKLGIDFVIPDLPGDSRPHAKDWLEIIDREVRKSDKPIVLVGHSLGTRAVLLYLDQYKQPIKALFLVAAFANRIENASRGDGETYPDFFEYKVDTSTVKKLCKQIVVLHSIDDQSIDYQQGKEIAQELDAKLVTLYDRRHMSSPSNAPYVLKVLREELHF